jgi:hypothetical protein
MCENPHEDEPDISIHGDEWGYPHEIPAEVRALGPLGVLRHLVEQMHGEQIPDWLAGVNAASLEKQGQFRRTVDQFLSEQVAFYPGAGTDGQLFSLFGKSGSVHCFVHADLAVSADTALTYLKGDGPGRVRGYDPAVYKIVPHDWWQQFERPPNCDWKSELNESLFVILRRQDGFPEDHGPEYLGFLHVSIDAYWLYWNLWGKREAAPYALLLQDHTWGGNRDHCKFGFPVEEEDTSPLYQMATQAELPVFLLVGDNTEPWPSYNVVSGWSDEAGASNHRRRLHQRPT